MMRTFLASCGHSLGNDFGWPGENGLTICHSCFEAEADESWWEMVRSLPHIGSPTDQPDDASHRQGR